MWLPILGLIIGLMIGSLLTLSIPIEYANYLAISVLAGLDSLIGGWRAVVEHDFDGPILISGFIINTILAAALAFLGDLVGLDLYLAAVVALGIRIFSNIGHIRRGLINNRREQKQRRLQRAAQYEELSENQ